ncbi:type VI secretion system baseplate subunit TssE [Limnobacter sp.]|uniref:type VI secretion system baseplate subunit TssE n=1 Tax=Limnobacter sp. TaxID=2003368 RepID=UPI0025871FD6|nr:type VI secretion system baseplate subunit TssE [Limnobacter sp.]
MNNSRDALQPALLDRLKDDDGKGEPAHGISKDLLRRLVLRDLESLFNSTCALSKVEMEANPAVAGTVIAYGMPPIAGQVVSGIEVKRFEGMVASLIRQFEPRIDPDSVRVKAETEQQLMNLHNVIGLQITGLLWNRPYPIELALRTEVDLETGKVALLPLTGFH